MKQTESRQNCNATIIFKDNSNADAARKALNLRKLKGRTIRIMWHERDNSVRYSNQGNIFIKNIPMEVKPREFFEHFLQFGDIVSAKLCEDDDGNHYGYGYVHFTTDEASNLAIDHCHKNKVWNEFLEVNTFKRKTKD
jgi:polyadenylate-binding protein